jgi:protein-disulfide isomerase
MKSMFRAVFLAVMMISVGSAAWADGDDRMADRVLGDPKAPVKVDEYVSLGCSHCAEFYNNILPEIEKKYVDTGKVKLVLHDYPLDGASLKGAALARCMPADEYYPFIKTLYATQAAWAYAGGDPVEKIIGYAKLGGMSEDKAKACVADTKLQDEIIAERTDATDRLKVNATPTFIINDGVDTINGAEPATVFAAAFDKILAAKK